MPIISILEVISNTIDGMFEPDKPEAVKASEQQKNVADKGPSKFIYPLNKQERYGASILFKVHEIVAPGLTGNPSDVIDLLKGEEKFKTLLKEEEELNIKRRSNGDNKITEQQYQRDLAKNKQQVNNLYVEKGGELKYSDRSIKPTDDMVKLYLPLSLAQSDGFTYSTPEIGAIGAGLESAMLQGKGILASMGDSAQKGASSVIDFALGGLSGASASLAMTKMATRLGKGAGISAEAGAAASLTGGVVVNPNVRALFKGVALREFSFQFKFIAKSQKEAEEVKRIIRRFRMYAYPESIDVGGISAGYKFPHLFELDIMYNTKDGQNVRIGNKMKKCYLKAISTTYNASSMAFHPDGQPLEIDLSLNFIEERTLTRADILEEDGF